MDDELLVPGATIHWLHPDDWPPTPGTIAGEVMHREQDPPTVIDGPVPEGTDLPFDPSAAPYGQRWAMVDGAVFVFTLAHVDRIERP